MAKVKLTYFENGLAVTSSPKSKQILRWKVLSGAEQFSNFSHSWSFSFIAKFEELSATVFMFLAGSILDFLTTDQRKTTFKSLMVLAICNQRSSHLRDFK